MDGRRRETTQALRIYGLVNLASAQLGPGPSTSIALHHVVEVSQISLTEYHSRLSNTELQVEPRSHRSQKHGCLL